MTLEPEITERIQAVETHLRPLTRCFTRFARGMVTRFAALLVFGRDEARGVVMRLTAASTSRWILTVPEFMERGFSPDMPWSLYVTASTRPPDVVSAVS